MVGKSCRIPVNFGIVTPNFPLFKALKTLFSSTKNYFHWFLNTTPYFMQRNIIFAKIVIFSKGI